jgi:hypothetical protein
MAIPDFTEFGLLPEGIHSCTLNEAAGFLCTNDHRSTIWQGLEQFLAWIADLPLPTALFVDGSFVTDKALPADVDVIVDITDCAEPDYHLWADRWSEGLLYAKENFGVDFYPFAAGHGNDFVALFQYVRVDDALKRGVPVTTRKGILRVLQQ